MSETLKKGDIVYIVVENFKAAHYHYDIVEAAIKNVPRAHLKEYDLLSNGNIYCRKRKEIYKTLEEAAEVAEKMADDYDRIWENIMGYKMERVWRKELYERDSVAI